MDVLSSKLEGCLIVEPKVHEDERGFFMETYHAERYKKLLGIELDFVQDNFSRSIKGVLRGLHFQKNNPQGKLVQVYEGAVLDAVVDIRLNSPTYGKSQSFLLSEENKRQLWVPPGFAHGFLVLSEVVNFTYKCTDFYDPLDEGVIDCLDPNLKIDWPSGMDFIRSTKDNSAQSFKEFSETLNKENH